MSRNRQDVPFADFYERRGMVLDRIERDADDERAVYVMFPPGQ